MPALQYKFTYDDGSTHSFDVDMDRVHHPPAPGSTHAPWTGLGFSQCKNCPLQESSTPRCPAAVDVEAIASRFASALAHTTAHVEVITKERTYTRRCDVQTALRSLLGVVMATSGCPILSELRGLARYHLPFATIEETLFRTTSAYLLRQYFIHKEGVRQPDWDLKGLNHFYNELQTVNRCFKLRLDAASDNDANLNAISSLAYLSMAVSFSIDDELLQLRGQFEKMPA